MVLVIARLRVLLDRDVLLEPYVTPVFQSPQLSSSSSTTAAFFWSPGFCEGLGRATGPSPELAGLVGSFFPGGLALLTLTNKGGKSSNAPLDKPLNGCLP